MSSEEKQNAPRYRADRPFGLILLCACKWSHAIACASSEDWIDALFAHWESCGITPKYTATLVCTCGAVRSFGPRSMQSAFEDGIRDRMFVALHADCKPQPLSPS